MANTIFLVPSTWDLVADVNGNIAMAQEPYSLAQDAASAILLFLGDYWYNTTLGIPYFQQIFGQKLDLAITKSLFIQAALTVPGVIGAKCYISKFSGRKITGQVQVSDTNGIISIAGFST